MNTPRYYLLSLVLVLSLWPSMSPSAQGEQGACLAWDISGEWEYRVTRGGYGLFRFQQNPQNGVLTGTWQNFANGASGEIDSGGVVGLAVGFHPIPEETYRGTVSADGKLIAGTYGDSRTAGTWTWEAEGEARCTVRQSLPAPGSGRATVYWGDYVFRVDLDYASQVSTLSPQEVTRVQRIVGPYGVTLIIEVVYYGDDLPNSVQVVNRYDGTFEELGPLNRRGTTDDGGVIYRGTVLIPQRVLGPGDVITNEVRVVNPWGREDLVTYVDQFIIDPSGYIYDQDTGDRIPGAMVSAYKKEGTTWVLWNAEQWKQTNPLVSNQVGHYGWDVPPGDYKVVVTHECYEDAESPVVTIPPPRTDVHIGMKKTGCSPLNLEDVWTTDDGSRPKTLFWPGDPIQYHGEVANSGSSELDVDLTWSVVDPQGQPVPALSGSGKYTIASFGTRAVIDETLPGNLAEGGYRLTIRLTHLGQTSMQVTQFFVTGGRRGQIYLPSILNRRGPPAPTAGIHGLVSYKGAPAVGIKLDLLFYNGNTWSTAATTTTDSQGRYRFIGVASLAPGQRYYVGFGPNNSQPNYVFRWDGPLILSYTAGTNLAGGDFDIANVNLVSPAPGATVSLPATFTWQRRMIPGDTYRWELFDLADTSQSWWTNPLGDVSGARITGLPGDVVPGKQYGWHVWVCNGPTSCGSSYYYRRVTFSSVQAQTDAPLPGPELVPIERDALDGSQRGQLE